MLKNSQGFTLLEAMIVVAIIAVISAIAIPNYDEYRKRANRADGQTLLADIAARQERFFAQNNRYITTTTDVGSLYGTNAASMSSPSGRYELQIASVAQDGGYTLTAVEQFGDKDCGNLTLDARGTRNITSTSPTRKSVADCWR